MSDHVSKPNEELMTYLQKLNMERRKTLSDYQSNDQIGKLGKDFPLQILIVEDQLINQRLMMSLLRKFGYNSVAVNNGKEAVDILHIRRFDLILMDIEMPVMNGVEASRWITSEGQLDYSPEIVAYTTKFSQSDLSIYLELGIEYVIRKPATIEKVLPALLSAIKKHHSEREI